MIIPEAQRDKAICLRDVRVAGHTEAVRLHNLHHSALCDGEGSRQRGP